MDKGRISKKTVIFDFDGVIHSYKSGWQGVTTIPDPPVVGIREALQEIRKEYAVVIVSTRCYQEGGIEAIEKWLKKWDIEVDDVTANKVPSIAIVDDRAITFDGDARSLLWRIKSFKTWLEEGK